MKIMNKKINKIITSLMVSSVLMSSLFAIPVLADEDRYEINTAGSENVQVTAMVDSTFKVVIPKKVELVKITAENKSAYTTSDADIGKYAANYAVEIKDADIAPNQKVEISVTNKIEEVEATLGATEKVEFTQTATTTSTGATVNDNGTDIVSQATANATYNYKLLPQELSAGSWSGTVTFSVAIK